MTNLKYSAINGHDGIGNGYDCDTVYCHQSKTILIDLWNVSEGLHKYGEVDVEDMDNIEAELRAIARYYASATGELYVGDEEEQAELKQRIAELWN